MGLGKIFQEVLMSGLKGDLTKRKKLIGLPRQRGNCLTLCEDNLYEEALQR